MPINRSVSILVHSVRKVTQGDGKREAEVGMRAVSSAPVSENISLRCCVSSDLSYKRGIHHFCAPKM